MFISLPRQAQDALDWSWSEFEPFAQQLLAEPLSQANLDEWMDRWTHLTDLIQEVFNRLYVATTIDTTDVQAENRFEHFLEDVLPAQLAAGQKLKEKLLNSGLQPKNFEIPMRNMQAEAGLFREINLPLRSEIEKLKLEYDKIVGAQTIEWEGSERTLTQLEPIYQEPDRSKREQAFRLAAERQLQDRQALNSLWGKLLELRRQTAHNAGLPSYTSYRWQELLRFDYTPADCALFRDAIEAEVVPAASRRYEKRRQQLGVDTLRPWDLAVDPLNRPPLVPYQRTADLVYKTQAVFDQVDSQLGNYFQSMQDENLLDLENRKGKAPGGYCIDYPLAKRPFIFMNGVGLHEDVQTLLHEGGHAFHVFEINLLPYQQQKIVPMEFAEVASMSMELLASPYLSGGGDSFYTTAHAAQARLEHLEKALLFWPYMAVVDGFQHWVYANSEEALDAANCDRVWSDLWDRYMPGIDYSGMEEYKRTGWQRKLHIFQEPFYYVEYGLAQLGAVQVWQNARRDQASAVTSYRRALSLGGTVSLPELFRTAGARFAFDAGTLRSAVSLIESVITELESA
jgi:oligoendopeptidase F